LKKINFPKEERKIRFKPQQKNLKKKNLMGKQIPINNKTNKKVSAKSNKNLIFSSKSHSKKTSKSSTSLSKKGAVSPKSSNQLNKQIKKKVYKKTPIKSSPKPLVLHSKRQAKKTERAIESAEQAKLFQILKTKRPITKKQSPKKTNKSLNNNKKVSFDLNLKKIQKLTGISKKPIVMIKEKPLQGIIKQVTAEERIRDLETKVKEIFQILKSKNIK